MVAWSGQTLYVAYSFPWIELTLPSKETILGGRFAMHHFHFHSHRAYLWLLKHDVSYAGWAWNPCWWRWGRGGWTSGTACSKLEMDPRCEGDHMVVMMIVDDEGEAGEELNRLGHNWIHRLNMTVVMTRMTGYWQVIVQVVTVSDANQGLVAAWRNAWHPKVKLEQKLFGV